MVKLDKRKGINIKEEKMGLDMYLKKEIYVGGNFEHREVKGTCYITVRGKELNLPLNKISTITLEMGYWRKANQIHNWFVKNVQKGVDDCGKYYVSEENLLTLRETCKQVLINKKLASKLLPPQSGFFFGGTDYDEYYFKDLKETIKIIDECLNNLNGKHYYRSSW